MPREPTSKYFWPASGLTESDMALLYQAREASPDRTPISRLIARAVRETYGRQVQCIVINPEAREAA